jgi:crossover junction endodeoxyribonuclease RuvC
MIVIGLDLSLTSTGAVVLGPGEEQGDFCTEESLVIKSKYKGEARLEHLREQIMVLVSLNQPDLIVIEGYAFGRPNAMAPIAELGGVVKHSLYINGWPFILVPPTRVKKFACGKGNAKKDEVRLGVYKRWGFEAKTNDEVDAYALARVGLAYLGVDDDLIKPQIEVVKDLKKSA